MLEKMKHTTIPPILWPLITWIGIVNFFIFYFIATLYYPGGSNFDQLENGFNWYTNYWCELLYTYSKNGHINAARPYAIVAMISMTISVGYFWYSIPRFLPINHLLQKGIQLSGIVSMIFSSFIFTNFHDALIYISVVTGSISFFGTIYGLFLLHDKRDAYLGLFCLFLIISNNLVYVFSFNLDLLPILQKITFLITLLWIAQLSIRYKKLTDQTFRS